MKNRFYLLLGLILLPVCMSAQLIVTNPAIPVDNQTVTITFDATQGDKGLMGYTGDIYAHTGVITDKSTSSTDWKYVKAGWNVNKDSCKLTRISANIYQLSFLPTIRAYYNVPAGEKILKMAFVFRNADGSKSGRDVGGKDIFVDVNPSTLSVNFSAPATNFLLAAYNEKIQIQANAVFNDSICLFLDGTKINSANGQTLKDSVNATGTTKHMLVAIAYKNLKTVSDTCYYLARGTTPIVALPAGVRDGINYIDNQTVTLVLYAPYKNYVYLIGDFNDWTPNNSYLMNRSGDRFWITLNGLTSGKEYIFQYFVDGAIRIADPYCDKVSDPYDDKDIKATVYPNLIAYPSGKTTERASVLQTGQTPYTWKYTGYTRPERKNLLVYELLIRDFTPEGTINAAKAKLSYLKSLGVNAIELMPFNEFEGNVSWGYNPNFYFAPDKAYGTKNDYKDFIDECHNQGFVVIQDMVLNHSYGSSPLARLYWDDANNQPSALNPWYNTVSPNTTYSWGCDFNHASQATKNFVDSVNHYWMSEYKVDGFRFDFVKGFTNTPGEGSAYDASRIAIVKRMADKIWSNNPNAYIILEYFVDNEEEKEVAQYNKGMMVWGNANNAFLEASMGYNDSGKSDFSWASASSRGYTQPGVISYMESHDEERMMFKDLNFGNTNGFYNIKNKSVATRRAAMCTAFFLSIPGPKMIWQFGEMGYDVSIDDGGRTGVKPTHWEYLNDTARTVLYNTYKAMLNLRKKYPVFSEGTISMSVAGEMKRINLESADMKVALFGNFGLSTQSVSPNFSNTGTWYELFSGKTLNVTSTSQTVSLTPGEYRLYTDKQLPPFIDLALKAESGVNSLTDVLIYPNPFKSVLTVDTAGESGELEIYSLNGQKLFNTSLKGNDRADINLDSFQPGMYVLRLTQNKEVIIKKIMKE